MRLSWVRSGQSRGRYPYEEHEELVFLKCLVLFVLKTNALIQGPAASKRKLDLRLRSGGK